MKRPFLWLREWLWYNQIMATKRNSVLFILGLIATAAIAFWLGRQSVPQMQPTINTQVVTDSSSSIETETTAQNPTKQSYAEEAVTGVSLKQSDVEKAAASASPQSPSGLPVERTLAQERLLAAVDLAGIEPESLQVYLKAWELLERDFYGKKPDSTKQLYESIRGLVSSYDEPYTFFIEPKTNEVEQGNLRGSFGGIGAYVEPSESGFLLRPMRDQPAANAGVLEGDLLTAVDDTEIHADMPTDDVVALIRGPLETEVNIAVQRVRQQDLETSDIDENSEVSTAPREELTFTIVRARIQTPSMDWRMLSADEFSETEWQEPTDLQRINQIGYIRHHTFSDRTPIEMRTALDELQNNGAAYFILDLRGNPGGPVNAVVQTTDLWINRGNIMREVDAQGKEHVFEATSDAAVDDQPLLIIIDGGSASASEILAGALRDHQRATLLGEKTFGKGSVQIIYSLPDDSSIHITNAAWFTPDGHEINQLGLQPDVPIEAGTDPIPQSIGALLDLEWSGVP